MDMGEYQRHLEERGFSQLTISSYLWVAEFFSSKYGEPGPATLSVYKEWLEQSYKPNTVNQRIQAINYYLGYLGKDDLRLKPVSVEKDSSEPSIDYASYRRLVRHLRKQGYWRDYHAIRLLVTAGLRVSKLLGLRIEDMRQGHADVGEGKAARQVTFLDSVAKGVLSWTEGEGRKSGLLFLNRFGDPITPRGFSYQLKQRAIECDVDSSLVHPQAFKNLFVRCFLEAAGDAQFLDELLG